jgi:serine/threonine-protein kinase
VETIPRRGYRFVAEIVPEFEDIAAPPAAELPPEPVVAEPASEPVAQPSSNRRFWIALAGVCCLAASIAFIDRNPSGGKARSSLDPTVRIGEHLLYKLAPDETVRASEHFERAIAADPALSGAHAGLAISLVNLSMLGVRPAAAVLPRADQAAAKAVELDRSSPNAHYASALVAMVKNWNFAAAETEFRQALRLDNQSVQSRLGYARLKLTLGDFAAAKRLVEEALQLDPASPSLGTEHCRVFYLLRDFRRTEAECRKVLDREPGYALAHYYLGLTQGALGQLKEARHSLQRSGLRPAVLEADYAWLSFLEGDRKPAEAVLAARRKVIGEGKVDASAKLLPATILGKLDEAYEALEAGLARRAPEILTLHQEPRLDPIRNDRRYSDILRRAGLPPKVSY